MTKILTVLVAAEHITDLNDTFTITREITDYAYQHKCSTAGFLDEETVTVRDLLYGTVLPSGGDAAAALAIYTAGSQEAFIDLMNNKLSELGLAKTAHFTNCVGLYDENHYCTVYDMAMILKSSSGQRYSPPSIVGPHLHHLQHRPAPGGHPSVQLVPAPHRG